MPDPEVPLDPPEPVWNIESLENVDEYAPFSHSFTYTWDLYPGKTYKVVVVPTEQNPETININGNNISGYYSDAFNIKVVYKTPVDKYVTVNNFRAIKDEQLDEVVEYNPDLAPNRTFTYTANVYDGDILVDSRVYTKTVNNNWDLNKNLLIQYVNSTTVTDPSLFKTWINSINAATVKWRNSSNVEINWA
jgi:hypothetical protein